jgi:hypothetical protein
MKARLASLLLLAAAACSVHRDPAHPRDLTGRWVRLREDSTWGDTMDFRTDGALTGSAGYAVSKVLTWRVQPDPNGGPLQYCASLANVTGFCRAFRLHGDTLELLGGTRGPTFFRRVH